MGSAVSDPRLQTGSVQIRPEDGPVAEPSLASLDNEFGADVWLIG
jgi:hypothetical protein